MPLSKLLFLVMFAFLATNFAYADMPDFGFNYVGYDIAHYEDVQYWEDCSVLCTLNAECKFWTWFTMDHPTDPRSCSIKTSDSGRRYSPFAISGPLGCVDYESC